MKILKKNYSDPILLFNTKCPRYGDQPFYAFVEGPHLAGSSTETVTTIQVGIYLPKAVT